jgi:hypothetical protein
LQKQAHGTEAANSPHTLTILLIGSDETNRNRAGGKRGDKSMERLRASLIAVWPVALAVILIASTGTTMAEVAGGSHPAVRACAVDQVKVMNAAWGWKDVKLVSAGPLMSAKLPAAEGTGGWLGTPRRVIPYSNFRVGIFSTHGLLMGIDPVTTRWICMFELKGGRAELLRVCAFIDKTESFDCAGHYEFQLK